MAETVQLHCRAEPRGVTYQWFKDNADNPIAGASKCDLYVRIESERDWGVYMCSVSLGSQPAVVSKRALVYGKAVVLLATPLCKRGLVSETR